MKADEIVRAVRSLADGRHENGLVVMAGKKIVLDAAADLIESLQAQLEQTWEWDMYKCAKREIDRLRTELTASQRREKAAVEDMQFIHCAGRYGCEICLNNDVCKMQNSRIGKCHNFDWRGPQEGESEEC